MATPSNPNSKTGSGFVNLQRYLQANKDNRLGQTLGRGLSKDVSGVQQGTQEAEQQFQQESNLKDIGSEANVQKRDELINKAKNLGAGQALDESDIQAYQPLRTGSYEGPKEIKNIGELKGRAEDVGSVASTVGGLGIGKRFSLLQRYLGQPQYKSGQQGLDALLIGPGKELQQARKQAQGLGQTVDRAGDRAAAIGQGLAEKGKQFTRDSRSLLGVSDQGGIDKEGTGALSDLYRNVAGQQEQYSADRAAVLQGIMDNAKTGQFTDDQLRLLGLQRGTNTFNVDLGAQDLYSQQADPSFSAAASAQQRAQLEGLGKLAGLQTTDIYNPADQIYDPNKPVEFDYSKYQERRSAGKAAFQDAMNKPYTGSVNVGSAPGYGDNTSVNSLEQKYLNPGGQYFESIKQMEADAARLGKPPGQVFYDYASMKERQNRAQQAVDEVKTKYGQNKKL